MKIFNPDYLTNEAIKVEYANDKICPVCGAYMKLAKKVFTCTCGFRHRKRTFTEILRDLGLIH